MTPEESGATTLTTADQGARVAAALELHALIGTRGVCREDGFEWPCPTALALGVKQLAGQEVA